MAVSFTFNHITMTLLITCVIFSITALATHRWRDSSNIWSLENEGKWLATKILVVAGTIAVVLALLLQILINVSSQFAVNRVVQLFCLVFVLVGFVGLFVGVVIYGVGQCDVSQNCGYSFWFAVIGAVLIFEATIFYVIAWRCPARV